MTETFLSMVPTLDEKIAKFCKGCRHYTSRKPHDACMHQCMHPLVVDPSGLTGMRCTTARKEGHECGPEGLLFEKKS